MSDTNRQWVLADRPVGEPTMESFELVEEEVPDPGPKEVLVRTLFMSVDPYMRGRMRDTESYTDPWEVGDVMRCGVVGEVVESHHSDFEEGDLVNGELHWAEYAVADANELTPIFFDPDLAPLSAALGVLGMPGQTAYHGLFDVGDPEPGDTLVVSGAAGAVGSVVGQLGKLAGCRVVGIAGADEKVEWLTDDLGFDAAINYNDEDVATAIAEACPGGVDVYFDNVGGPITDAVMDSLAERATISVCGQISMYNATEVPTGPRKLITLIEKRASAEGFIVSDYEDQYAEAGARLAQWVASDGIEFRETVTEGIENAPDAFFNLFEGTKIGKQVVKVAER